MNEQQRAAYEASVARARQREKDAEATWSAVNRDRRRGVFIDTIWVRLGAMRQVILRRAQVRALDAVDLAEFRDNLHATPAMIDALLSLAAVADLADNRDVCIDFEAGTVTAIDPPTT